MKSISVLGAIALAAALAACGGGGGGSTGSPIPITKATPTSAAAFPQATGKPQRYHNSMDDAATQAATHRALATILTHERAMDGSSPSPSPSASASASPSPTPVPLPSPSGNPLIPTRIGLVSGILNTGQTVLTQVLDPTTNQPVLETSTPTTLTNLPQDLTLLPGTPYSGTDYPDAWGFGMDEYATTPALIEAAIEFPDSTGVVNMYRFDGFYLSCGNSPNSGFANLVTSIDLTSGVAVATTPGDIGVDCANQQIDIPSGYQYIGTESPDTFGAVIQNLHDYTQVSPTYTSQGTTITMAQLGAYVDGTIDMMDRDGIHHKIMIFGVFNAPSGGLAGVYVADLAANASGVFPF